MEETGTPREEARFWFLSPEAHVLRLEKVRRLEAEERRAPDPENARIIGQLRHLIRKLIRWYVAAVIMYLISIAGLFTFASSVGVFGGVRVLFKMRLTQSIAFCLIVVLTYAAFWLRKNYKITYAIAELAIGVPSLAVSVAGLKDVADVAGLFPMATAVFLMIRGMDNLEEGKKLVRGRALAGG